jgi:hypothetical protein
MYGASLAASRHSLIAMDLKMECPISQQLAFFACLKIQALPNFVLQMYLSCIWFI